MCDTGQALSLFGEVCRACNRIFERKIQDAYRYGSYARWDYHGESDLFMTVDEDPEKLSPTEREYRTSSDYDDFSFSPRRRSQSRVSAQSMF